jgi:3-oxoacyl-[acyl-carrier protein] reductase
MPARRVTRDGDRPVAIVTGGGRGIGRATAETFTSVGWIVVVAELRPRLGEQAGRALRRSGATGVFVRTDVARPASIVRLVRTTLRRFGRIDALVNNAGVLDAGPLARLPVTALDRMVAVNLRGPLLAARAVLPAMLDRGRGAIVNVASQLGRYGAGDYVTYCATKFGVVGFTEALADELPPAIRVWAVCPGLVDTPLARRAVGRKARGMLQPHEVARVIVDLVIGRRHARSGDAVDVVR